jgi:hypothetical protein
LFFSVCVANPAFPKRFLRVIRATLCAVVVATVYHNKGKSLPRESLLAIKGKRHCMSNG